MEGLELFTSIPRLVRDINKKLEEEERDVPAYDELVKRTAKTLRLINDLLLLDTTTRDVEFVIGLTRILSHMEDCQRRLYDRPSAMSTDQRLKATECPPKSVVGRPRLKVALSAIHSEHENYRTWNAAARVLGVSRNTLYRRRRELRMDHTSNFSDITDDVLDKLLKEIIRVSPTAGERMLMSIIRGRGIVVQRERLRRSIRRVGHSRKRQKSKVP